MDESIVFYYGRSKITGLLSSEDNDLALLKWAKHSGGYAHHNPQKKHDPSKGGQKYLHRIVMERMIGRPINKNECVDHINGNPSDNRRCNLRLASNPKNRLNTRVRQDNKVGYKGVCFYRNRYWAYINVNNKRYWLGYKFTNPVDAAIAYDKAAIKLHGEFASTNFPKENYDDPIL
jgi:hypothetical protein